MKEIVFLVSGGGTDMQSVLDAIKDGRVKAKPRAVISSKADAFALKRGQDAGMECYTYSIKDYGGAEGRDKALFEKLCALDPDLIVLAGYLGILPAFITDRFKYKIINIHPALLPKYGGKGFYGLNVHRAVIEAGEKVSGATVHFVDAGTDTGLIIAQREVLVLPDDTAEMLQDRILKCAEHTLLPEVVAGLIDGSIYVENGKVFGAPKE